MLRSFLACLGLLFSFAASISAHGAQRTFVATTGSDANTASNCSNTAPCRGFTAALTVTDSGGEIIVLNSGGYGPVTIGQSVSIIAQEGVYAGISVFSGDGITIATPGVDVMLKGLSINGLGGTNGIYMTAGNSLVVQNCTLRSFLARGMVVTSAIRVRVLDSLFEGNTDGAYFSNGPSVLISGSRFIANDGYGVYAFANGASVNTKVEFSRSEVEGSTHYGIFAYASSSGSVKFHVRDSLLSRNDRGIYSYASGGTALATVSGSSIIAQTQEGLYVTGSGARLVAGGNTVTHNRWGLSQGSSGVLLSAGDNIVSDNTTADTNGVITPLATI
jgi:hypothetical protein